MNEYEQKQEQRRERLERAADKATTEAARRFQTARDAVAGIPFGQPILVGHHSEKRHRRAIERQDTNMRKGSEAMDAARELARRADAIGTGGISSDDPDAVAKLADKRTDLEIARDHMKSANAFYKKNGTLDGWDGPADIRAHGESTIRVWRGGAPFPSYSLQNIGARIRAAAKRSTVLERAAERREAVETGAVEAPAIETIGDATIEQDVAENRVILKFGARLSHENYKRVRSAGFVWARTRNAFVRKLSTSAIYSAQAVARVIAGLATGPTI